MSRLVKRITVIQRGGSETVAAEVHTRRARHRDRDWDDDDDDDGPRRRVTAWTRPIERAARKLWRAQILAGQEGLRRQNRANRRRRDGWIIETPVIIWEAGREAYNEARKAVPFRILPKV